MPSFHPQRALLSVSDECGIVELAKILHEHHVELIATTKTANILREADLPVTEVRDGAVFPQIMDTPALEEQSIKPFDLLIINLYPFEQIINEHECEFTTAIENIDIAGPAMIRSAAKNHDNILVIITPDDYPKLIECIRLQSMADDWRFSLAQKAFARTAAYDAVVSNYMNTLDTKKKPLGFPAVLTCQFQKKHDLPYGENPHQHATFYLDKNPPRGSLAQADVIQGTSLSYNNLLDADAAFDCIKSFSPLSPTCVIVKQGNPCGIAIAENLQQAYLRAFKSDPAASYDGILAFNQQLDEKTACTVIENQFVEVIIAPAVSEAARKVLASRPNIRVLVSGKLPEDALYNLDMRRIDGGLLIQEHDGFPTDYEQFKIVTMKPPSEEQKKDLLFAWLTVKHLTSNAIVIAKNDATVGIGAGQTSRVMSIRIALWQAGLAGFSCENTVMASDTSIPFTDSLELAINAGITAIIQPGGSIRDQQIIDAANIAGISMVFTGMRHFRH